MRPEDSDHVVVHSAQLSAAAQLNAFNALRTAPFRGGAFATALEQVPHNESQDVTLVHRFAIAISRAQEVTSSAPEGNLVEAFRKAVQDDATGTDSDGHCAVLPHQFWIHSRTAVASDRTLAEFMARHEAVLDAELLSATSFGELIQILHRRNRDEVASERGLRSGALLLALMFDFWAVWCPRRFMPLKRKDYFEHGTVMSALHVPWARGSTPLGGNLITISITRREPLIKELYYVCDAEEGICELPWNI